MNFEQTAELERRAAVHAALADARRLRIVDLLAAGDASSSELARVLGMSTNLLAHHLNLLVRAGLVEKRPSEGDQRRSYLRLVPGAVRGLAPAHLPTPARLVFVCTANTARSHLAAALWRRASRIPATSAGTHPAETIDPGAIDVAVRHALPLPRRRPRHVEDVLRDRDLVITVCDLAHEEVGTLAQLHWSVSDPVQVGSRAAFDAAFDDLAARVTALEPRLDTAS